jgi:CobQ-like glutamine amidotransferase family enzyme
MAPERRRIKLAHLYPDAMDLYADNGNVLAVRRRCEWRGIDVEVVEVLVGQPAELDDADLIVMGGGQDAAQVQVASDLVRRGAVLRELIDGGAAALLVCGGFQLFGTEYVSASGESLPGIGVFDARTVAGDDRVIGNIATSVSLRRWGAAHAYAPIDVVGFENHAGRTVLGPGVEPFGSVIHGGGNLGDGSVEGAVYRNAVGTYLHGPLLPKNPRVADHLIIAALAHRYGFAEPLAPLDDVVEMGAHRIAFERSAQEGDPASAGRAAG